MNQETVIKGLLAIASRCGVSLSEWETDLYLDHLEPLGWPRVVDALRRIYLNLDGRGRMPSVNEIRAACGIAIEPSAPTTVRDEALDVASRIVGAIARPGSMTRPGSGGKVFLAEEKVGELAWAVVQRIGGWPLLCESHNSENSTTWLAQIRDVAASMIDKAKRGTLDLPPAIPRPALPGVDLLALPNVVDVSKFKEDKK